MLFVTAYKDISREKWEHFQRDNNEYLTCFKYLVDVIKNNSLNLVCFCDEPLATHIKVLTGFVNIYPYDDKDTFINYVDEEKRIMNIDNYQSMLRHRLHHPEHCEPMYNIVQHNKVSFVRRASDMFPDYSHYTWVDFGHCREDINKLKTDIGKITSDKIHYGTFEKNIIFEPPVINCIRAPAIIQGSFFSVPKNLTHWYENAYRDVLLNTFYKNNITDDDQAIVLYVYKDHPDKFHLHHVHTWLPLFKHIINSTIS